MTKAEIVKTLNVIRAHAFNNGGSLALVDKIDRLIDRVSDSPKLPEGWKISYGTEIECGPLSIDAAEGRLIVYRLDTEEYRVADIPVAAVQAALDLAEKAPE